MLNVGDGPQKSSIVGAVGNYVQKRGSWKLFEFYKTQPWNFLLFAFLTFTDIFIFFYPR